MTGPAAGGQTDEAARLVGADWQSLVDLARLSGWMDAQGLGQGPISGAELLAGGTQNVLLRFERAGRLYVLRRPPRSPRMDGSKTMRREARVLGALAGTPVPHPGRIAACAEDDVLGAAFYQMEPVDGFNVTRGLPEPHRSDPQIRHRMGLAMVDAIVELGRVDVVARGIADLGRTEGFLERQVGRWRSQLESYREYEGWPGPAGLPDVDEIGAWLDAHRPSTFTPGLIHGDFHLANVMFRHDSGELAALVDWELSTIGDPLLDLGWLLATWPDDEGRSTVEFRVQPWEGFARTGELVERYAQQSGRDLAGIGWYAVLACYKLALILEGTHARAFAGKATQEAGDRLHKHAVLLLERASRWIAGGG